MKRIRKAWLPAAFAFMALAAGALAQVHSPNRPIPVPTIAPSVPSLHFNSPTPLPMPKFSASLGGFVHAVRTGERVPLSRLPRLPMKTAFNTIVPGKGKHGGRFHPMAATGASITVTAAASCTSGGTVGDLFNVGCQLSVQASGITNWNGTDNYQYYVVPPNATTATEFGGAGQGCVSTNDPWQPSGANLPPTCTGTDTTLSVQGTYQFFVYDTNAQVIVATVFVNAGQVFTIQVFQDAYHTEQSYQYDTQYSNAAYIYLQNVAASDKYVVYVENTGVNAYCVYLAPGATPSPAPPSPRPTGQASNNPNNLLCNPTLPQGVNAPGGNLALTWTLNTDLEAGAYAVVVYDQSTGTTLGQVQVSLTSTDGTGILTEQSTPAPPATNPSPGQTPQSTTIVAWDSVDDQSVAGITGTTSAVIPAATYTWSIQDPNGTVVSTASQVLGANGTITHDFVFNALPIKSPGQYPSLNWVMQLYNPTLKTVIGSQAFQVYGYSSQTQFDTGVLSNTLNFPCGNPCTGTTVYTINAGLRITNTGNSVFPNAADSFNQMIYATASETTFTIPPSNTGQDGVWVTLGNPPGTVASCVPSCTLSVKDSNSNSWNVTDYCSSGTVGTAGGCVLLFQPALSSTTLTAGSYIEIPKADLLWSAQSANNTTPWPCYNTPCSTATSVLPTHGIAWSSTGTNSPAWTVATIGSVNSAVASQGTATVAMTGSCGYTGGNPPCPTARSTAAPYPGAHFYEVNYDQADYQASTPFQATSGRDDIIAVTVNNTTTCNGTEANCGANDHFTQVAVGIPAFFNVSGVHLDTQTNPGGWASETCPNGFGPLYFCVKSGSIAVGGTSTFYLDVPPTTSSYAWSGNDFQVSAYNTSEFIWTALSAGTATATAPVCGGGAACGSTPDGLSWQSYSLNSNIISAAFQPSIVTSGTSPTQLSFTVTNASLSADPNPDPIDLIVLQAVASGSTSWSVNGTPSYSNTNWTMVSPAAGYSPGANNQQYWFGVCAGQNGNHGSQPGGAPPQSPPNPTNPSGLLGVQVPTCTAAQENNSLAAGGSQTVTFSVNNNFTAGSYQFYVYVHGANGGGWSAPIPVTLTASNESANANFYSVQSPTGGSTVTVANGSVATISNTPNEFVYELTNTGTASIGKVDIALPAFDTSGQIAKDTSGNAWTLVGSPITTNIVLGTISGGTFKSGQQPTGCTVNAGNTFNPNPGNTNGQIEVSGCTGFTNGKILAVEFQSAAPQIQNDSYLFPATLDTSFPAALTWIGSDEVTTSFSIGLTVVVNPKNPGPGGSTPVVSCPSCAFSGSTVDFGAVGNSSSVTGLDVVRSSVVYTGATTSNTWTLSVGVSSNPTCTGASCGGIANELLIEGDNTKANGGNSNVSSTCTGPPVAKITVTQLTWAAIGSNTQIATGTETQCGTQSNPLPYDVLENYKIQVGTETITGSILQVTYTLVAN